MPAAAQAWTWLTGTTLASRSHLQLVGQTSSRAGSSAVDIDQAKRQADALMEIWYEDERYLAGQPLHAATVVTLGAQSTGRRAQWLWRFLAFLKQQPTFDLGDGWLLYRPAWTLGEDV